MSSLPSYRCVVWMDLSRWACIDSCSLDKICQNRLICPVKLQVTILSRQAELSVNMLQWNFVVYVELKAEPALRHMWCQNTIICHRKHSHGDLKNQFWQSHVVVDSLQCHLSVSGFRFLSSAIF